MEYKLQYDVSSCSKELKRDFNIDSVMSDDDLSFDTLEEFKSYVELLNEIESDGSDITINNIIFKIEDIKYSIHDNTTFCIIKLYCEEDEEMDDEDDLYEPPSTTYNRNQVSDLISAYIKAGGKY